MRLTVKLFSADGVVQSTFFHRDHDHATQYYFDLIAKLELDKKRGTVIFYSNGVEMYRHTNYDWSHL